MTLKPFESWPLLAAGLAILGIAVGMLVESGDQALAAFLLIGVGAVMAGAGIANVLRHPPRKDGEE